MITAFPKRLSIGRQIRDEREKAGYVQKWCASQCDYSERQWQYWEHGEYIPTGRALRAIIRLFPNLQNFI